MLESLIASSDTLSKVNELTVYYKIQLKYDLVYSEHHIKNLFVVFLKNTKILN